MTIEPESDELIDEIEKALAECKEGGPPFYCYEGGTVESAVRLAPHTVRALLARLREAEAELDEWQNMDAADC